MSSSSLGERLKWGESVIQLKDVVTEEECRFLRRACTDFASQTTGTELEKPGLLRLPTIAAAKRAEKTKTPCADPLPIDIDELVQEILLRVVNMMDDQLPRSLVETLFFVNGNDHDDDGGEEEAAIKSLSKLLQRDQLKFSSREPAINVYTTGGEFLAHKDAQALTVLLPLSSETVHFEGGGTAFWSQDSRGHRVEDPSIVLKPNAGTVLLFGGCVTHAGQPLLSGTRVVFVASFSPMIGQEQQQQQVEENFVPQRDIYGDSM